MGLFCPLTKRDVVGDCRGSGGGGGGGRRKIEEEARRRRGCSHAHHHVLSPPGVHVVIPVVGRQQVTLPRPVAVTYDSGSGGRERGKR